MLNLPLSTAGFAEFSAAESEQLRQSLFAWQVLIVVGGVSTIFLLWASIYWESLRQRKFTTRSLLVLMSLFGVGVPLIIFLTQLARGFFWI